MGFFDALKGAVNAVTGGGAKVTVEYSPPMVMPGGTLTVKVTATSTGGEVKSAGIFVDLLGSEQVHAQDVHATPRHAIGQAPHATAPGQRYDVSLSKTTYEQSIQIAPAFVLGAKETKVFQGQVTLPTNAQPSFQGQYCKHAWSLRGRQDERNRAREEREAQGGTQAVRGRHGRLRDGRRAGCARRRSRGRAGRPGRWCGNRTRCGARS